MLLRSLLLASFTATTIIASSVSNTHSQEGRNSHLEKRAASVNVYVHVVSASDEINDGNIPDAQIHAQMAVLNSAFAQTGAIFRLSGLDRTINPRWSTNNDRATERQMKERLRRGGPADLNMYIVLGLGGDIGKSTFPWDYASNPVMDGCSILYNTLPGGWNAPFNLGITAVREVGHWLGLHNTFRNGCQPSGDYVDDTPSQASGSQGCPVGRDTCPGPGLDPIHNYMDSSDDACRNQFTPGQVARLQAVAAQFRGIFI